LARPAPPTAISNVPASSPLLKSADVDAIHPGYGLLSETPNFAEVCRASNIKFHRSAGPEVTRLMGEKDKARQAIEAARTCPFARLLTRWFASVDEAQNWQRRWAIRSSSRPGSGDAA